MGQEEVQVHNEWVYVGQIMLKGEMKTMVLCAKKWLLMYHEKWFVYNWDVTVF